MKLLLLGTGGYHPNERRQTACLMLPEAGIVLDAGTGFFRVRQHLATPTLDVLLTHAHLDHIVGLTYLLSTTWQRPLGRITVHAAAPKLAAIREHLLNEQLFPAPLPCAWQSLAKAPLELNGVRVTYFPLDHPGGCVGYRLEWRSASQGLRSLAYVTDTTASPEADYLAAIGGVDVLVHECNFTDAEAAWAARTGHSSTTLVAQVAAKAGAGRLVLVHFNPLNEAEDPIELAAARRVFAKTAVGYDGMEIEV